MRSTRHPYSEESRRRTLTASIAMASFAIMSSLGAIGWGLYTFLINKEILRIVGGPVAGTLPHIMTAMGLLNLIVASRSICVAAVARRVGSGHVARSVFKIGFNLAALVLPMIILDTACGFVILCSAALADLTSRSSIFEVAFAYYGNPQAQNDLDNVQARLKCCGAQSPTDWAAPIVRNSPGNPQSSSLPLSCCPALNSVVEDCQYSKKMAPGEVTGSVVYSFHDGCIPQSIGFLYLNHFWSSGIAFSIALLMLLVAVTQRLAQTSARAALESGDAGGPAPAWLFRDPRARFDKNPSTLWPNDPPSWPKHQDSEPIGRTTTRQSVQRQTGRLTEIEEDSSTDDVPPTPSAQPISSAPLPSIKQIRLQDSGGISGGEEVYEVYSRSGPPAYYGPDGLPLCQDQVHGIQSSDSEVKLTDITSILPEKKYSHEELSQDARFRPIKTKKKRFSFSKIVKRVVSKSSTSGKQKGSENKSCSSVPTSDSEFTHPGTENLFRQARTEVPCFFRPTWADQMTADSDRTRLVPSGDEARLHRSKKYRSNSSARLHCRPCEKLNETASFKPYQLGPMNRARRNQTIFIKPVVAASNYFTSSDIPTGLSETPMPTSDENYMMGAFRESTTPNKSSTSSRWSSKESSPERMQNPIALRKDACSQTSFIEERDFESERSGESMGSHGSDVNEMVPARSSLSCVITDERMPINDVRRKSQYYKADETQPKINAEKNSYRLETGGVKSRFTDSFQPVTETAGIACKLIVDERYFGQSERKRARFDLKIVQDDGVPNDSSASAGLLSVSTEETWITENSGNMNDDGGTTQVEGGRVCQRKEDRKVVCFSTKPDSIMDDKPPFRIVDRRDQKGLAEHVERKTGKEVGSEKDFAEVEISKKKESKFNFLEGGFEEQTLQRNVSADHDEGDRNFRFTATGSESAPEIDIFKLSGFPDAFKRGYGKSHCLQSSDIIEKHPVRTTSMRSAVTEMDPKSVQLLYKGKTQAKTSSEMMLDDHHRDLSSCQQKGTSSVFCQVDLGVESLGNLTNSRNHDFSSQVNQDDENNADLENSAGDESSTSPETEGEDNIPASRSNKLSPIKKASPHKVRSRKRFSSEIPTSRSFHQSAKFVSDSHEAYNDETKKNRPQAKTRRFLSGPDIRSPHFKDFSVASGVASVGYLCLNTYRYPSPSTERLQKTLPLPATKGVVSRPTSHWVRNSTRSKLGLLSITKRPSKSASRSFKERGKADAFSVISNLKDVVRTVSSSVYPQCASGISQSIPKLLVEVSNRRLEIKDREEGEEEDLHKTRDSQAIIHETASVPEGPNDDIGTRKWEEDVSKSQDVTCSPDVPVSEEWDAKEELIVSYNSHAQYLADNPKAVTPYGEHQNMSEAETSAMVDPIGRLAKSGSDDREAVAKFKTVPVVPKKRLSTKKDLSLFRPVPANRKTIAKTEVFGEDAKKSSRLKISEKQPLIQDDAVSLGTDNRQLESSGLTTVSSEIPADPLLSTNERSALKSDIPLDQVDATSNKDSNKSEISDGRGKSNIWEENLEDPIGPDLPVLTSRHDGPQRTEITNTNVANIETNLNNSSIKETVDLHSTPPLSRKCSSFVIPSKKVNCVPRSKETLSSCEKENPLQNATKSPEKNRNPCKKSSEDSITGPKSVLFDVTEEDLQNSSDDGGTDETAEDQKDANDPSMKFLDLGTTSLNHPHQSDNQPEQSSAGSTNKQTGITTVRNDASLGSSLIGSVRTQSLPSTFNQKNFKQKGTREHTASQRHRNHIENILDCWTTDVSRPPTEGEFTDIQNNKKHCIHEFDSILSAVPVAGPQYVRSLPNRLYTGNSIVLENAQRTVSLEDISDAYPDQTVPLSLFLDFIAKLNPTKSVLSNLYGFLSTLQTSDTGDDESGVLSRQSSSQCLETGHTTIYDASTNLTDENSILDRRRTDLENSEIADNRNAVFPEVSTKYRISQDCLSHCQYFRTNALVRDTKSSDLLSNASSSSFKCNYCDCSANQQTSAEDSSIRVEPVGRIQTQDFPRSESDLSHSISRGSEFFRTSDFDSDKTTSTSSTSTDGSGTCTCASETGRAWKITSDGTQREDSEKME